jgi:single-stranded DNA-binding protein
LQSRFWETSDGQKRSAIDVRAERVQFLGSYGTGGKDKGLTEAKVADAAGQQDDNVIKPEDINWDE